MNRQMLLSKSSWQFFLLVFLFSVPFWLIGPIAEQFLQKEIPLNLPISSLQAVSPLVAALILVYRENGSDGVQELLKRTVDFRSIKKKAWFIPAFFLLPMTYFLAYVVMRLSGASLPDDVQFPVLAIPVFLVVFFIAAACEESGWSGFAIDRLQKGRSALHASIILGGVWAILHIIPDIQAQHVPTWIVWQRLYTVVLRILIVWLYNNTHKSVFAAIIFHATDNVSFALFPNYGSHYNPFFVWLIATIITATVVFVWGPKTFTQNKFARLAG